MKTNVSDKNTKRPKYKAIDWAIRIFNERDINVIEKKVNEREGERYRALLGILAKETVRENHDRALKDLQNEQEKETKR